MTLVINKETIGPTENKHDEYEYERGLETIDANTFWIGVVATRNHTILEPEIYKNAQILRGRTYIDELDWLPEDARLNENREQDSQDGNSRHVAVVDTRRGDDSNPFVFANMRYIYRREPDGKLPIEEEYGHEIGDLEENSIELSRFISRHPESTIRSLGSIALASHTVATLNRLNLVAYAIIEETLVRHLKGMGVVVDLMTGKKTLDSYGETTNYGVRIDGVKSLERAKEITRRRPSFPFGRFFDIATNGTNEELMQSIIEHLGIVKDSEELAA